METNELRSNSSWSHGDKTAPAGRDLPLRPSQKQLQPSGQNSARTYLGGNAARRSGAVACPTAYGRQKAPGLSLQGQAAALSALKTVKPSN